MTVSCGKLSQHWRFVFVIFVTFRFVVPILFFVAVPEDKADHFVGMIMETFGVIGSSELVNIDTDIVQSNKLPKAGDSSKQGPSM